MYVSALTQAGYLIWAVMCGVDVTPEPARCCIDKIAGI